MRLFSERGSDDLPKLVDRARRGDSHAWAQLVDRFQNLVYSIARRTGLNSDDAGDVFQATFLALYKNLDRIEQPETLPKWISVTAARESLKLKRNSARYVDDPALMDRLDDVLADEEASAETLAIDAEDADYWRKALVELGGRCEQLLSALYLEERSYEEITDTLGMPTGAIGPTRSRCLEKLRKLYQRDRPEAPNS